jgi:hypothetical protein
MCLGERNGVYSLKQARRQAPHVLGAILLLRWCSALKIKEEVKYEEIHLSQQPQEAFAADSVRNYGGEVSGTVAWNGVGPLARLSPQHKLCVSSEL